MLLTQSAINQKEAQIQWRELIKTGSHALTIELTVQQLDLLVSYIEQLSKWNKAYNLTAVRDPLDMIKLHIFDSLAIIRCLAKLNGNRFIDIGTGAGLPGMVLAIVWPQKIVHLLDTNGKKTRFLTHFKHLHQLNNVEIINQRCENYLPELGYDVILSRAFATIKDMLNGCQQLVTLDGFFVAMKGIYPAAELDAMPANYCLLDCDVLQVPGVDAERHLITIQKQPA
tara:strand:- start:1615 stop:2295 length:681 start_codon:yes stop_codon:yes gene_type:complete